VVSAREAADRALEVLVILDGASEPLRTAPTSLERARTPMLDRLAEEGTLTLLPTVPPGLPAGSETAIPGLLGWVPDAPLDRGAIEAAAHDIEVADGERAWRVDRRDREDAAATAHMLAAVLTARLPHRRGVPRHRVHHLAGHRMLVVGPDGPPTLAAELLGIELRAGLLGAELFVWPRGEIPPRVLDEETVVIGARGAAVGIARLLGARTIVPPGATGRPGTDLAAKAAAAIGEIAATDGGGGWRVGQRGTSRIVVHVGSPDEAAHECDADAKVASIEAADALLLGPLAGALRAHGGTLRVCPDHGCDPATGKHDHTPVPCLDWPSVEWSYERTGMRLTERAAAEMVVGAGPTEPAVAA
jgi:2,3-bisphosphoglycerate-independent phosphoglycerate mutase